MLPSDEEIFIITAQEMAWYQSGVTSTPRPLSFLSHLLRMDALCFHNYSSECFQYYSYEIDIHLL